MKNFILWFFLVATLLGAIPFHTTAQTLVNLPWQDTIGHPLTTIPYQAASTDHSGNLYIGGSTYTTGAGVATLLAKYSSSGTLLWSVFSADSINSAYITVDIHWWGSDVYLTGMKYDSATSKSSIFLFKYNSGTGAFIWNKSYTGSGYGYDIPAAVSIDDSGYVYIAGTDQKSATESQMVVIRYDSSGNQKWVANYDTANMFTGGTAMVVKPQGSLNKVTVTGFSGTGLGSWSFVTANFNRITGAITGSPTWASNGNGNFSSPAGVQQDDTGRMYVAGTATHSGSNTDVKIIAYDTSYNERWLKIWGNTDSLADSASRMVMDSANNVLITGYTTASNGTKQLLVLKYNSSGTLQWSKTVGAPNAANNCVGKDITTDANYNVYVTGYIYNGANNDFITIAYDPKGNMIWEQVYDGGGTNDVANDVVVSSGGVIFVTGVSSKATSATYLTLEYEPRTFTVVPVTDSFHHPIYVANEVIVKFNPKIVNTTTVNNLDWVYGSLSSVVPDSVVDSIAVKLGIDSKDMGASTAVKIFTQMTTVDSLSVTRLGDTITTPKFWSTFRLIVPSPLHADTVVDSLPKLHRYIQYADLNFIGYLMDIPNDPYYDTAQAALHATTHYPSANINIIPAWNIETGKSYVKVGVVDCTVAWWNEDFGNGTFDGSKIAGGWDLYKNLPDSLMTYTQDSHGTTCAGIIGALRNNGKGIAGVAGGDVDTSVNPGNGCTLYSLGILNPQIYTDCIGDSNYTTTLATVSAAIAQGAALSPNPASHFGFGVNIENNSWGITPGLPTGCAWPPGPQYILTPDISVLRDAVRFCFMNQCVMVSGRGNEGVNDTTYPACFQTGWGISVGASGTDGMYKKTTNGDNWWSSSYGQGMDLIAPGTTQLITTTQDPNDTLFTADKCSNYSNNSYTCFNGTSSAAAFVSGVAALMLSRHNVNQGYANNLAPDDVKNLVDDYATDVVDSALGYGVGYDSLNGWGLLNAGAVMAAINAPKYKVFHSGSPQSTTYDTSSFFPTLILSSNPYNVAPGTYSNCMQVQVIQTYSNTFSTSTRILHNWERLSSTNGISSSGVNDASPWASYSCTTSANTASVTMLTYAWHITDTTNGINQWIPTDPSHIKTAYSLQLYDSLAVTGINEVSSIGDFSIYPNPTSSVLYVSIVLPDADNVTIRILDITGRTLMEKQLNGSNQYLTYFPTLQLASGLYLCEIETSNGHQVRKFVKR